MSSAPTPSLYVDTFRIDQVIRNLITNAIKFTPPGGNVDIKISCVAAKPEATRHKMGMVNMGYFRVEVTDSGAGIDTKDKNEIFGEFIQFNRNEQQQEGGSGLGLWISRRIIDMHLGSIGFTSQGKGMGATFFVELPIYVSSDLSPRKGSGSNIKLPLSMPDDSNRSANCNTINKTSMKKPNRTTQYASSQPNDDGLLDVDGNALDNNNHVPAPCSKNSPLRLSASSFLRIEGHRSGAKVTPLPSERDDSDHLCHHANTKPLRILIVDDSGLNWKVLRRQIQSEFSGIWQNAVVKDTGNI